MVVEIIWFIANIPQVTTNLKPNIESVLPQKLLLIQENTSPQETKSSEVTWQSLPKDKKYIGEGTQRE